MSSLLLTQVDGRVATLILNRPEKRNALSAELVSEMTAAMVAFNADEQFLPIYQLADENNKKITHLDLFAEKFLTKCTLGSMISKYMVLVESEQRLLIMRPYQIYAVKAIIDCIQQNSGNGYIWHTTGSGKTCAY